MSNRDTSEHLDEFDIISDIFAPLSNQYPGAFDLQDDCACFMPEPGYDLVLSKDTLVSGVHFFADNPPESIARKALAVNLSDIASKGAESQVYLLSISLPEDIGADWLKSFANGLMAMQQEYGVYLIGGDTVSTPGPLTISITIMGQLPAGTMCLRKNAKAGDLIYVTGTIGDSWLGLQLFYDKACIDLSALDAEEKLYLKDRFLHPAPRIGLRGPLQDYVNAAMDISDGLGADLLKLCKASNMGAEVDLGRIPVSGAAGHLMKNVPDLVERYLINGGDDYEILACVNPDSTLKFEQAATKAGVPVQAIGRITEKAKIMDFYRGENQIVNVEVSGYNHFK